MLSRRPSMALAAIPNAKAAVGNSQLIQFGRTAYEVTEAGTAAQALDEAAARKPALVLLDLGLPDGSGLDLVTELRRLERPGVVTVSTPGFAVVSSARGSMRLARR